MYKILIKDSKTGMYRYLTVKQEIMKEQKETVTDEDTHEEKKCIELLASYKVTEFTPINTLAYTTDLVWSE